MTTHAITANKSYSAISPAPEDGDDISMANGSTLTIDVTTKKLGSDSAGAWGIINANNGETNNIVITSSGVLRLNSGVSLLVSYNSGLTSTFTGEAGGAIEYYGSYANQIRILNGEDAHGEWTLGSNGGAPFTISNLGSGQLTFGNSQGRDKVTAYNLEFTGDIVSHLGRGVAIDGFDLDEDCGTVNIYGNRLAGTDDFSIKNMRHRSTGTCFDLSSVTAPSSTQKRDMVGIICDGPVNFDVCGFIVWDNFYWPSMGAAGTGAKGSFKNGWLDPNTLIGFYPNYVHDCLVNNTDLSNPHDFGGVAAQDIHGCVFVCTGQISQDN